MGSQVSGDSGQELPAVNDRSFDDQGNLRGSFHQASDIEELSQIFSNHDQQNFSMSRPADHLWIELVGLTEEL